MSVVRVFLHGLVRNADLNGQKGTVVEVKKDSKQLIVRMDCGRLIQVDWKFCYRVGSNLTPMKWGPDPQTQTDFFLEWRSQIVRNDPLVFNQDVYTYLRNKVTEVVNTKQNIKQPGWSFRATNSSDYVHCVVWADGTRNQERPLTFPVRPDEQWWPCIAIVDYPFPALVPFYCPALAWMDARPWLVHTSRIRRVETPGPTIEEVSSELDEEDWMLLPDL